MDLKSGTLNYSLLTTAGTSHSSYSQFGGQKKKRLSAVMEMVQKEDSIQAFIEYLVTPFLDLPHLSPQELENLVADQMYAVALVYNFYLRKDFPYLRDESLEFFCQLAVINSPNLLHYFDGYDKVMSGFDVGASITVKRVKEALEISRALDSPTLARELRTWKISKIAVFVADSTLSNCILTHGSLTRGVYSLIEKELDQELQQPSKLNRSANNEYLNKMRHELACSIVEENTGIERSCLELAGTSFVYSLTKKKSASQLFLMKCTNEPVHSLSFNKDVKWTRIDNLTDSVEGSLVDLSSKSFIISNSHKAGPSVAFFHLRPYWKEIHDWLRGTSRQPPTVDLATQKTNSFAISHLRNSAADKQQPLKSVTKERIIPSRNIFMQQDGNKIETLPSFHNESGLKSHNKDDYIAYSNLSLPEYTRNIEGCTVSNDHGNSQENDKVNKSLPMKNASQDVNLVQLQGANLKKQVNKMDKLVQQDLHASEALSSASIASCKQTCGEETKGGKKRLLYGENSNKSDQYEVVVSHSALPEVEKCLECFKQVQNPSETEEGEIMMESDNNCAKRSKKCTKDRSMEPSTTQKATNVQNHLDGKTLSEGIFSLHSPFHVLGTFCKVNQWNFDYVVFKAWHNQVPRCFYAKTVISGPDFELSKQGELTSSANKAKDSAASHMLSELYSQRARLSD